MYGLATTTWSAKEGRAKMRPATAARTAHLLVTLASIACVLMRCRAGFDGGWAFVVPPVVLGASGGTYLCPFCLAVGGPFSGLGGVRGRGGGPPPGGLHLGLRDDVLNEASLHVLRRRE